MKWGQLHIWLCLYAPPMAVPSPTFHTVYIHFLTRQCSNFVMHISTHYINLSTAIMWQLWTQFCVPHNASYCNQIINAALKCQELLWQTGKVKGGLQHKSALFLLGGSSGSPQTELGAHPPSSSICHPVSQPAPTWCWKSQSTLSPLGTQTTQHDSVPIPVIKATPRHHFPP